MFRLTLGLKKETTFNFQKESLKKIKKTKINIWYDLLSP